MEAKAPNLAAIAAAASRPRFALSTTDGGGPEGGGGTDVGANGLYASGGGDGGVGIFAIMASRLWYASSAAAGVGISTGTTRFSTPVVDMAKRC